ncbi:hypothetical protein V8C42DRAFT_330265 [Trichoderma barbatum]
MNFCLLLTILLIYEMNVLVSYSMASYAYLLAFPIRYTTNPGMLPISRFSSNSIVIQRTTSLAEIPLLHASQPALLSPWSVHDLHLS